MYSNYYFFDKVTAPIVPQFGSKLTMLFQGNAKLVEIFITASHIGQRLDNFLIRELRGVPKSLIYRLLRQKKICVNGQRVKPSHRVNIDQKITLPNLRCHAKAPMKAMQAFYSDLSRRIIEENPHYLVLNKPADLACHGGSGLSASVIDIFRTYKTDLHLVHRLDKGTSGCLVLAKNRRTLLALQAELRLHTWHKYYVCIVQGIWPKQIQKIELPLKRTVLPHGERRVFVDEASGKPAKTWVRRIACDGKYSVLAVKILTGRTHQIRVHCAHLGYPIVGDDKYGIRRKNIAKERQIISCYDVAEATDSHIQKSKQTTLPQLERRRLYLHAAELILGTEAISYEAQLDQIFSKLCPNVTIDTRVSRYF